MNKHTPIEGIVEAGKQRADWFVPSAEVILASTTKSLLQSQSDKYEGELSEERTGFLDHIKKLEETHQREKGVWEEQQINYERKLSEYYNLIHAVESKFDGENRYETALRYIQQAEQRPQEATQKYSVDLSE